VLPAIITVGLYGYLIHRLAGFGQWDILAGHITGNSKLVISTIAVELILLLINIGLESEKWRHILSPVRKISINQSVKSTLIAMSLGNITPGRAGEHIGRIISTHSSQRSLSVALSLFSSIIQTVVITTSFVVFIPLTAQPVLQISKLTGTTQMIAFAGITLIAILAVGAVIYLLPATRRTLLKLRVIATQHLITWKYIGKTLLLSILRYIVFSFQMALIIWAFAGNAGFADIIPLLPAYFFAITVIPSFFLADIAIKGSVALFVFGSLNIPESGIIAATFALWIINNAIPTVAGHIILTKKHQYSGK
jgi:hypothetical protein